MEFKGFDKNFNITDKVDRNRKQVVLETRLLIYILKKVRKLPF